MKSDVIIIGAGIAGLTSAALLSKRGFSVCVIDAQFKPGGSCGIFKRKDVIFEQGAAMIYGFGRHGFNPHRFVFNCLEEPIDIIKHDELYAINFKDKKIIFHYDIDKFTDELGEIFPTEKENFKRFYKDMSNLYLKVIAEQPIFTTPDMVTKEQGMKQFKSHPIEYMKFLTYMNKNTEYILKKYFKSQEVFDFFDKLTSTYCYTSVKETPAILSSIMFVDNHFGGSYYPVGSTLNFIGKLEKVIEENNGDMIYNRKVEEILIENKKVIGVKLDDNTIVNSSIVINSGNVWNLYNKLLKDKKFKKSKEWANSLIPTYPSLVLFSLVKKSVIPNNTLPIEMLINDTTKIDEGEVTVYILSIDDKTLCSEEYHTVIAIGPSFKKWPSADSEKYHSLSYEKQKEDEKNRMIDVLERRFPGFKKNLEYCELSTPTTLERYSMKEKGAVAGPKQQLGQHMLKRLNTRGEVEGLYNCGESTVMGTGTPAVTISGISAANLILRDNNMEEYEYRKGMKDYVHIIEKPYSDKNLKLSNDETENRIGNLARLCQYCEEPPCEKYCNNKVSIRDINRRLSCGNFKGGRKLLSGYTKNPCEFCNSKECEKYCIRKLFAQPVNIKEINTKLKIK